MADRRTPLYDRHLLHKARMVPFGGWEMPVQYAGILDEHKAVRTACGLFDISHMARLSFAGSDTLALLEKVFTNTVGNMKDGQVKYGLICNEAGGILDDVLVYKWPYGYAMVVNAGNREKIVDWLKKQMAGTNVELDDQTFRTSMIALQGPKAVEMMKGRFADDVTGLKYYYALPTKYGQQPCVVSRTGYTGEDGFEIMLPNALAEQFWNESLALGAVPCGLGARDTLRLEAAMPLYGHELNEETTPLNAGLAWAVKMEKSFIGKEALAKPPARARIGLELDGKRAAREGSPILFDGEVVGRVTSGSYAPHVQKSIAMGYVPAPLAQPGAKLEVDLRGSIVPATIVPLPFYKKPKTT
jgi:aminomethyltransferase